jgi:RNA polymerase sigma-70 factor (ECF subfamily)
VYRVLGNVHETEDVVQEVFFEAYRVSRTKEISNWPGFLRRLAICRSIDRLRTRCASRSSNSIHLFEEPCALESGPFENAVAKELEDRLRIAVGLLPGNQAEVFSMRCFEEMSYEDISEALGISINAVAIALHKSRTSLQASFAQLKRKLSDE